MSEYMAQAMDDYMSGADEALREECAGWDNPPSGPSFVEIDLSCWLTNLAQILDVVKQEWSAEKSWSAFDQEVRRSITLLLSGESFDNMQQTRRITCKWCDGKGWRDLAQYGGGTAEKPCHFCNCYGYREVRIVLPATRTKPTTPAEGRRSPQQVMADRAQETK